MSLAAQAATTVVALIAAVAAVSLWRGANRHTGSVRRAYRMFALTSLLWGAGAIGLQALASASAGATFPFTVADLPGLLALPALVAGLYSLGSRREAARHPLAQPHRARIGTAVARCADGYVVAAGLFIIGWITVLSAEYVRSGDDPRTFAAELVHPLADLLVLGGVLPLAVAAGRRGAAPVPRPARGDRERYVRGRGQDQQRSPRRGLPAAADRRVYACWAAPPGWAAHGARARGTRRSSPGPGRTPPRRWPRSARRRPRWC